MKKNEISGDMRLAIEKGIHHYFESRRQKIPVFVENHFSFQETRGLQKKFFLTDLIRYPLNTLWAIPYLTLKQGFESCHKMGWKKLTPFLNWIPSGIETQYQKQIEKMILSELLEIPKYKSFRETELFRIMESQIPKAQLETLDFEKILKFRFHLNEKLDRYSSSRQFISDVAGNLAVMGLGWFFFGNHSLSLHAIAHQIAGIFARDKAADGFFLGKDLGKSFYQLFPPQPTQSQILISTCLIGLLFIVASLSVHLVSDPLRKKMGFQQGNLHDFLNELENSLLLEISQSYKQQNLSQANQISMKKAL